MGVQSVRAKARRKLMHLSLRLAFYIRMELIRIDEDFPRDRSSKSFVEYRNEILNKLHFGGKNNQ